MGETPSGHQLRKAADYVAVLHPAVTRTLKVLSVAEGQETILYDQEKHNGPTRLEHGEVNPPQSYSVEFQGGLHRQHFVLNVSDPGHKIARIRIELFGEDRALGWGEDLYRRIVEYVEIENDAVTCPPNC